MTLCASGSTAFEDRSSCMRTFREEQMHLRKHPPPATEVRNNAIDVLICRHEEVYCLALRRWLDIVDVYDVWREDGIDIRMTALAALRRQRGSNAQEMLASRTSNLSQTEYKSSSECLSTMRGLYLCPGPVLTLRISRRISARSSEMVYPMDRGMRKDSSECTCITFT